MKDVQEARKLAGKKPFTAKKHESGVVNYCIAPFTLKQLRQLRRLKVTFYGYVGDDKQEVAASCDGTKLRTSPSDDGLITWPDNGVEQDKVRKFTRFSQQVMKFLLKKETHEVQE